MSKEDKFLVINYSDIFFLNNDNNLGQNDEKIVKLFNFKSFTGIVSIISFSIGFFLGKNLK